MTVRALTWLALSAALSGCGPKGPILPNDALDHAIATSIGDPNTCVLIAQRATRRVIYQYGVDFNCTRALPACDRAGALTARKALALADVDRPRRASCPTTADGSRTVGWAEGRIAGDKRDLIYSAAMEGQRALPGHEMALRLSDAFTTAGL